MGKKLDQEKMVFKQMVEIYCKGQKHADYLCEECTELIDYAYQRIALCPFGEKKTFCSECKVHCFKEEKRSMVKKVMRYSGPRMIFHHPILALRHALKIK